MKCRKCGREIPAKLLKQEAFRCPSCGNLYRKRQPPANSVKQTRPHRKKQSKLSFLRKKLWILPVWGWLVILLLGIIGMGMNSQEQDTKTQAPQIANPTAQIVQEEIEKESKDFDVLLDVTCSMNNAGKPSFMVETNLPDGIELMFTLTNGEIIAQDKAVISGGKAESVTFLSSKDLPSGRWTLTVSCAVARLQSEEVREIIGEKGEYMHGDYVEYSDILGENNVSADFYFDF